MIMKGLVPYREPWPLRQGHAARANPEHPEVPSGRCNAENGACSASQNRDRRGSTLMSRRGGEHAIAFFGAKTPVPPARTALQAQLDEVTGEQAERAELAART